jgi:hypothetical protein
VGDNVSDDKVILGQEAESDRREDDGTHDNDLDATGRRRSSDPTTDGVNSTGTRRVVNSGRKAHGSDSDIRSSHSHHRHSYRYGEDDDDDDADVDSLADLDKEPCTFITLHRLSLFALTLGKLKDEFRWSYDFQATLQAYCDVLLYRELMKPSGIPRCVDWFLQLLQNHRPGHRTFEAQYPGVRFIHRDAVNTLYQLMNVRMTFGIDLQAFIDLLQRSAEDMQLLDLEDEKLDDWVPDVVIRKSLEWYLEGFCDLMRAMHVA